MDNHSTQPAPNPDTRLLVKQAADELMTQGIKPTVANVRERTGRGSAGTINEALKEWWSELSSRLNPAQPELPKEVVQVTLDIWRAACSLAEERLEQFRQQAADQITAAELIRNQSETALAQLQSELKELNSTNAALQKSIEILEKQLSAEAVVKQQLEQRQQQIQQQHTAELNEVQQRWQQAQQDLLGGREAWSKERLELLNDNQSVRHQLDQLNQRQSDLLQQLEMRDNQRQQNRAVIADLDQKNRRQELELTRLKTELKSVKDIRRQSIRRGVVGNRFARRNTP